MVNITAAMVKELRTATSAGMMDCKNALVEAEGNIDRAKEILREKGLTDAAKKAGRIAAEGVVESYIHMGGRIGVLVEVNCETDFVAITNEFKELVKDIAMQIAAAKPLYVTKEEVPAEDIEKEKEMQRAVAINEGKNPNFLEKIIDGRMEKFYQEIVLMSQPFVKDDSKTIEQVLNEAISKIGEKISIRRFARYEMGEGLEKRSDNFAEEVMSQMK